MTKSEESFKDELLKETENILVKKEEEIKSESLYTTETEILTFTLPKKHRPGTDLISKMVLKDKRTMEMILTTLIGEKVHNSYILGDGEWADRTKSDVLYVPATASKTLPPVLIEVQHTVNSGFMDRAISYCLSVKRVYKTPPILLIICVNQVSPQALKSTFVQHDAFPFMMEIKCDLWAKECLMLSSESIHYYINKPKLNPLVALTIFFTRQKQSLIGLREREDPNIQLLYTIAKEKLSYCYEDDEKTEVILDIVEQMEKQLQKILICSNDPTPSSNPKLHLYIKDGIDYLNSCKSKYSKGFDSDNTVAKSTISSNDTPCLDTITTAKEPRQIYEDQLPPLDFEDTPDMVFIKEYYLARPKGRIVWAKCFAEGQNQGFFEKHDNAISIKDMYYKHKNKK
ncbi:hypothetical protein BD770DRAFT_381237 [Pilaira anomala]|nr:hypothetical protein BD770DRAFT_381237 [Pilaira anomala]